MKKLKKIAGWTILLGFGFLVFKSEMKLEVTLAGAFILYALSLIFLALLVKAAHWVIE